MFRTFVNLFERLTRSHNSARKAKRLHNFNGLETLEDRSVPSASVSGFVYTDNNNNGIMDAGDTGVPGATVLLNNSAGTTVSTATTDPTGAYQFTLPDTPSAPGSSTVTATLNLQSLTSAPTSAAVAQFNPALGRLTSVEIVDNSSLNSSIKVENGSSSADTMTVQVMGDLMLQGDGLPSPIDLTFTPPGDTAVVTGDPNAGPLGSATNPINFSGVNSHDFGTRTLTGSRSIVLDGGTTNLSAFEGTGDVNLSLSGQGFTGLTAGSDGILQYGTSAQANVEIIYHYQPPDTFTGGDFTIVQPGNPAAPYTAGQLTAGNVTPIPNSYGQNAIPVSLNNGNHPTGYNFGQVPPGSISGFVYSDANDNGVKESNEAPVAGVQVTLTGTNDLGQQVTLSQATSTDGSYNFVDLRSGTYTVTRGVVPSGFIDGKNTPGTPGNGQVLGNSITSITVQPSVSDPNNNFGLVQPGSVAGFVYYDRLNAGTMVPGDSGIPNVLVTLTGENDLGAMLNQPIQTAADGSYSFGPLRPGIYQITETPPAGYLPGTNNLGTLYGTLTGDTFTVFVQSGNQGQNYNFGNVLPPPPPVVPPPPPPVVPPPPPVVPPPPPIMPPPPPAVPPPPPPMLPPPPPPVVPPPPPPQDLIPQSPPPPPPQIPASKRSLTGNAWLSWDW